MDPRPWAPHMSSSSSMGVRGRQRAVRAHVIACAGGAQAPSTRNTATGTGKLNPPKPKSVPPLQLATCRTTEQVSSRNQNQQSYVLSAVTCGASLISLITPRMTSTVYRARPRDPGSSSPPWGSSKCLVTGGTRRHGHTHINSCNAHNQQGLPASKCRHAAGRPAAGPCVPYVIQAHCHGTLIA